MVRREESLLRTISQVLGEREGMGFNDLFRELRRRKVLGSRATLAKYLGMLEEHGKIQRRVIREKPPRLVEYRRVKQLRKAPKGIFQRLSETVGTSDTVKVTLTDVLTGKRRVLILDRDNNWVPLSEK